MCLPTLIITFYHCSQHNSVPLCSIWCFNAGKRNELPVADVPHLAWKPSMQHRHHHRWYASWHHLCSFKFSEPDAFNGSHNVFIATFCYAAALYLSIVYWSTFSILVKKYVVVQWLALSPHRRFQIWIVRGWGTGICKLSAVATLNWP